MCDHEVSKQTLSVGLRSPNCSLLQLSTQPISSTGKSCFGTPSVSAEISIVSIAPNSRLMSSTTHSRFGRARQHQGVPV